MTKTRKTFQLSANERFFEKVQEVANEKGISLSEAIRTGFDRYYSEQYRKEIYGYQAGTQSGDRSPKAQAGMQLKASIEKIATYSEEELISFLKEIGFYQANLEVAGCWYTVGNHATGRRGLIYHTANERADSLEIENGELTEEVRKFLKTK